jgi:hypothetical protein
MCRVPPFDFIWCRLGYILKAKSIEEIIDTACTISGHLRGISESSPEVKTPYIQVEKVSNVSPCVPRRTLWRDEFTVLGSQTFT